MTPSIEELRDDIYPSTIEVGSLDNWNARLEALGPEHPTATFLKDLPVYEDVHMPPSEARLVNANGTYRRYTV